MFSNSGETVIEIFKSSEFLGTTKTVEWRGRPVFVRHRTPDEIEKEKAQNMADLRDPEKDEDRTVRPEWLVVIAVCTHLGCTPLGTYVCVCECVCVGGCVNVKDRPKFHFVLIFSFGLELHSGQVWNKNRTETKLTLGYEIFKIFNAF